MGAFVRGDVVVVPFPLSVDATTKRRPALVVASWAFGGAKVGTLKKDKLERVLTTLSGLFAEPPGA